MKKKFYLMESRTEGERLKIKTDIKETYKHLEQVNFHRLKNKSKIIDAGAGVGIVSQVMRNILRQEKKDFKIYLLDISNSRLDQARNYLKLKSRNKNFEFISCNIEEIPLPANEIDFIFCRFVFEYLSNPRKAFSELYRILKPGGKLVIGDLDMNCLCHYPIEKELEEQLFTITSILKQKNLFDPHAGRKLFSYFHDIGALNIRVHASFHHLFYGNMKSADRFNWETKIDRIIDLQKQKNIDFGLNLTEFKNKFLKYLDSFSRFAYTPYIMVEGIKKHE
ncbi:MAG: class I SAM-dependent methyltransferase [Endomicrobiales bacterium]|nr:class I SAM-dependent methyltransferase [Endomicrobiales bacterium]